MKKIFQWLGSVVFFLLIVLAVAFISFMYFARRIHFGH